MPLKPIAPLRMLALKLTLLALLVSGCASNSPPLPSPVVPPPQLPPLPPQGRQPTRPEICSPTCSSGLTKLRTTLLDSLTKHLPLEPSANGPMAADSLPSTPKE